MEHKNKMPYDDGFVNKPMFWHLNPCRYFHTFVLQ